MNGRWGTVALIIGVSMSIAFMAVMCGIAVEMMT